MCVNADEVVRVSRLQGEVGLYGRENGKVRYHLRDVAPGHTRCSSGRLAHNWLTVISAVRFYIRSITEILDLFE